MVQSINIIINYDSISSLIFPKHSMLNFPFSFLQGYGFVRFYNEQEYNKAVSEMNGASGLGTRTIRVNKATKSRGVNNNNNNNNNSDGGGGGKPDFMDPSMIPGFMQLQMQYMQQMQVSIMY